MDPVPERLATSVELDLELAEPTAIVVEPLEKRVYVACKQWPSVSELINLVTEAGISLPEDIRGVLIGKVDADGDMDLAVEGRLVIVECKGHIVLPPELRSCLFFNARPETIKATRIRKESVKLHERTG